MNRILASLLLLTTALFAPQRASATITIDTVPVGNVGNANDPGTGTLYGGTFGGVNYAYKIGKYEVTNAQYAAFLAEKAKSDPLALYNTNMDTDPRGGITRSGMDGNYSYAVKTDMGNKPVNYVSWYDAARFTNWLHNNQGIGDTETGAYTLLGGTATPSDGLSVTRNAGANWFIPTENEWFKAAYHQPAAQGGDTDDYWDYPTRTNNLPMSATANLAGDISNPGSNVANYNFGADWNSLDGNITTVGSAGALSESFYGTSDQGGNVYEWNETVTGGGPNVFRIARGGSWNTNLMQPSIDLLSPSRNSADPTNEAPHVGFRVATIPEPSSILLWAPTSVGLLLRRRTFR